MKLKKTYYTICVALAMCLIHTVSAQNWTDTDNNHLFDDPNNWATNAAVPGPNDSCFIGTTIPNSSVCTILDTDVETVGTANGNNVFGPQWGATLNIYGSLSFGFIMVPVQFDSTAQRSVINQYSGSSLSSTWAGNTMLLGDAWFTAQPYVTWNMYGNAQANYQYLGWGGHLNIYDNATNTITLAVFEGGATGYWGLGGVSDATRQIDLVGGTLVLPGAYDANVTNWISRGIFLIYGKAYDTNEVNIADIQTGIDTNMTYVTNDDTTITTNTTYVTNSITVVTPPALGTLQNIYLQSPRSTMMVGTFQNPVALGNFSGISGVPLSALDAAQLGGGTVVYSSSDTNVVGVTTNGHVTAISPGTSTVSATFGAFTSTNSVLITVTPFTNSLIHRYSFSESSGTTTTDSVGGSAWDGTLNGGATLGGGQVTLDGSSGYVQLPAGIVSNMDAVTIEAWANFSNATSAYNSLYYFGDQDDSFSPLGENYIAFQPYTGATPPTANALFGAGDPGYADEQDATLPLAATIVDGVTNYQTLGNSEIAVVYQPYAGYVALYTNGVLAAINNNVSNPLAATLGADPLNYLGQSLYGSDPFLNASIDEFRIYNGPLTAAQIATDYALGPNQLPGNNPNVKLTAVASGGNLVISWPTSSALVNLMSSPTLGAGASWTSVGITPATVGSNYQVTVPISSSTPAQFFRLQ